MILNTALLIDDLCTQGFHIIDDLFEQSITDALCQTAQQQYEQGLFRSAKIGHKINSQQNKAIRTDEILWLEEDETNPSIQHFLLQINQLAKLLNQSLFLGLYEFETHFAHYPPGTYYKKHSDQFAEKKTRQISFVYYLNQHWQDSDGGELQLYDQNDQLIQRVAPKANRFICFKSEIPHEVATTLKPRYSITGWLKTRHKAII